MGLRPWRLHWATALLAAGGACLAAVVLYLGVRATGGSAGWLGWTAAGILAAAVLGFGAGAGLGRRLKQLRRGLLQRDSAAVPPLLPSLLISELQELARAADLLANQVSFRASRLEQQSAQLVTLVQSVSDGLLRIGPTGRIEFLNPAARTLLDLPHSAEGLRISALVRSLEMRQLLERALQGERVPGTEITLGERRILVSAQPLQDTPAGREAASGTVVALSDLTALRRLEGVRRDFVANVSHELKTPLTSIRGYAETLLGEDAAPEIQRQFLEVIQRNAARLQRIVDELLDLSVIESGGWKPQVVELTPANLISDVWLACSESATRRGITFTCPTSDLRVLADPGALRQVMGNLLDNAIRYTPDGGGIQVRLAYAPGNGTAGAEPEQLVVVEVIDNGSGIPSDALPRIFERFYRVDPARSRAAGGTGLGLAIVKHMVEGMGGEVSAQSELGKGTTIRFTLPAPASRGAVPAPGSHDEEIPSAARA